ncbi:cobalt-precorrin-5B (C(1))-methyltransferase [Picrophilus oshimae]|uniref:Precorrin-2 C20-methyltransferase n=1 Tax=Picrophilus torridus (strain ATCC 700027 / DSM 9790 / JCM 10055 / NBRC 100828 / KAW 2/3) TaxID=1122961 RepID=Q6L325_PICTO|nr:cobalt-precorrin-5B (C(1))-methyltransferase [Picrophilus oshimae]AAT42626.1 precorrin-2 C20-methyltransferase [Picrophilus oshimae DSM 9789]
MLGYHYQKNEIRVFGGTGVGVVTREGLPVKPGNSAINPVPMRMIKNTSRSVLEYYKVSNGADVLIYVPGGNEVAKKPAIQN